MARKIPALSPEFIATAQRRRAVIAVAEVAHEFGTPAITTNAVCRIAKMSRTTFYRLFDGLEGCLRYSFAESFREIVAPMATAIRDEGEPQAVAATIETFYTSVAAHPLLAELCLVHSYGFPEAVADNGVEAVVVELASQLAAASNENGRRSLPFVDEFLARAIISLAASRARQGRTNELAADGLEIEAVVEAAYPPARCDRGRT